MLGDRNSIRRFTVNCRCGRGRFPFQAFTLVEVLVVISVIALLIAILLPSLAKSRENARSVICRTNLREWGHAIQMYVGEYNGYLPYEDRPTPGMDANRNGIDDEKEWVCWFDALNEQFGARGSDLEGVKICPTVDLMNPDREESYRMNSKLMDSSRIRRRGNVNAYYLPFRKLGTLNPIATRTVLLFDGHVGGRTVSFKGRWRMDKTDGDVNFRHNDATNFLFADMHIENLVSKAVREKSLKNDVIIWQPEDMGPWNPTP